MAFNPAPKEWFTGYEIDSDQIKLGTSDKSPVAAIAQEVDVTTVADSSGSLDGKYFDLEDEDGTVRVWMSEGGVGTAPAEPAGGRLVEVAYVTDDSATVIAGKIETVIDADSKFGATSSGDVVTVTNATAGAVPDPDAGDSGFTVTVTTSGADEVPMVSLAEVTTAQADADTGDIRRVVYAFVEALHASWQAKDAADRPTSMNINRVADSLDNEGVITETYSVQFKMAQVSVEIKDE